MGRGCCDQCQLLHQGTVSLPTPPSLCSSPLEWGLCSVTSPPPTTARLSLGSECLLLACLHEAPSSWAGPSHVYI